MHTCRTFFLAALGFITLYAAPTRAQDSDNVPKVNSDAKRVAIVPLGNKDGTDGAREKSMTALRTLLENQNYRVVEGDTVKKAYEEATGETPGVKDKLLTLRDKDLLAVGRTLKVDFVIAANLRWHTKSIYVFPTLRTKADCTVDALVVDVAKAEVVIEKTNIQRNSENKNAAAGVIAVLGGLGYGAISGGPKTPPQTVSAVNALYVALEEFVGTKKGPHKINEDKKPAKIAKQGKTNAKSEDK